MNENIKNQEERFVDEEEEWVEGDAPKAEDIASVTRNKVRKFRKQLNDNSKTAAAIDRNAPWMEISQCAAEEGYNELASFLFEAEQQGLDD
jgi:hypothetical protein